MKNEAMFISAMLGIASLILSACAGNSTPVFTPEENLQLTPSVQPSEVSSDTQVSPKDGMVMDYVPAGEFLMGSPEGVGFDLEHPQQKIYLDAYWIDQTEVTNAMFAAFVKDTNYQTQAERDGQANIDGIGKDIMTEGADWAHPMGPNSSIEGREQYPVEHVSWNDARAYCQWAGRALPTESQWEKAARGTDGRIYPWGNTPPTGQDANILDKNYVTDQSDLTIDDGYQFTAPVGSYPDGASPFGALDMAGNVFEWVRDGGDASYSVGWTTTDHAVIRGGSYRNKSEIVRAALRAEVTATVTDPGIGFRCALSTQTESVLTDVSARPSIPAPVVPAVSASISVENIDQLTRLTSLGVGQLYRMTLSPEGKYLEIQSTYGVQILDASNLAPVVFLPTAMDIYQISFVDGDSKISARNNYQGYLWSLPDGKEIKHARFLHTDPDMGAYVPTYYSIPDAAWQKVFVYSVPYQKTGLYQVDNGEAIYTLDYDAKKAVISPDSQLAALSTDDKLVIVHYEDGNVLQEIPESGIESLFFFPDSQTLAEVTENQIKYWNMRDFSLIDTINGAGSGINYDFSPDQSILVFSAGGVFRFYRTSDRALIGALTGKGIQFTADSQGVFVDNGNGLIYDYVFSEDRSEMKSSLSLAGKGFNSLLNSRSAYAIWNSYGLSADGKNILAIKSTGNPHADDISAFLAYDISTGSLVTVNIEPNEYDFWAISAVWLPEMHTFAMLMEKDSGYCELYLLDTGSKSLTQMIGRGPFQWDTAIQFSPGSDLLVYARGIQLVAWDIKNGGYWPIKFTPSELVGYYNFDTTIRFSEDGKQVIFSDAVDANRVFSTADYSLESQSTGGGIVFGTNSENSPDGRYSAWISGTAPYWKVTYAENGSDAVKDLGSGSDVSFAFSPDSRMIAVTTRRNVTIFDLSTGEPLFNTDDDYYIEGDYAPRAAFSPDGKYFAIITEIGYPQIFGIP